MKSVIDCDGVFEILTLAPFPTGSPSDQDVETHLQVCHECRNLAEALRPAVGLFHESLADDESLPRYDDRLADKVARRALDSRWTNHRAPLIAAGLAACLLTWLSYAGANGNRRNLPTELRGTVLASPDAAGMATLRSLPLAPACLAGRDHRAAPWLVVKVAGKPLASAQDLNFGCCTQCHRSGGTGPASARAMRALDVACAACHRPPTTATAIHLRTRARSLPTAAGVG